MGFNHSLNYGAKAAFVTGGAAWIGGRGSLVGVVL